MMTAAEMARQISYLERLLDQQGEALLDLLDRIAALEKVEALRSRKTPLQAEVLRLRARAARKVASDPSEAGEDLRGRIDTEAELTRRVPR